MFFFFFFFTDKTNDSPEISKFDNAEWQQTANKGEWSELYTLYKLLADQNLYPFDKEQKVGERLRLPILSMLRYTEEDLCAEYRIDDDGKIHINANGYDIIEVDKDDFKSQATELLNAIKAGDEKASFEIRKIDEFRKLTCCPKIKCYSKKLENGDKDKSDLYIVIHDALTGQEPKQGFSIKSELGNPPTLVNATKLTNFKYRLSQPLTTEQVDKINSMLDNKGHADIQSRVRAIIAAGSSLEFDSINPNKKGEYLFYENLILIDSSLPEIIARILVMSYTENTRLLDELTEKMSAENPLNFPMRANKKYYEAKVKRFVTDVALGMLPSQPWEATHQSSGVLVVTETGDIDCYHVIYKASLDDYLYHDLKFETPSASRHGFGSVETDETGTQYFSLNLQLRFLK